MEKKYIVSEYTLISLLAAEMQLAMLERDGVDSWTWFGESYKDVKREFIPSHVDHEGLDIDEYSFTDIAKMRLEGGEYEEITCDAGE